MPELADMRQWAGVSDLAVQTLSDQLGGLPQGPLGVRILAMVPDDVLRLGLRDMRIQPPRPQGAPSTDPLPPG